MAASVLPESMWLSSTEHPFWGKPRCVHPRDFVLGPAHNRQYLWLSVELSGRPSKDWGWDGDGAPPDIVVTSRFDTHFPAPRKDAPVHVHLWALHDRECLQRGRFEPRTPAADAWCELYSTQEEAEANRARW